MANYNVRIDDETKNEIESYVSEKGIKQADFLRLAVQMIPLFKVMDEKEMSAEEVINKINAENNSLEDEVKIIRKGVNEIEFKKWLEKLIRHNENANEDDRVFITQNLFLDLIGGNVNSISKLYKENKEMIMKHNDKFSIEVNQNRKLSSRIREEYGNVANWLKSKYS